MGVRTRSATSSPVKKTPNRPSTAQETESHEPLRLFVLPRDISQDARILSLPHPSEPAKKRFLFCPSKGLFEFKRMSSPSSDPRSILLTPAHGESTEANFTQSDGAEELQISQGYVNKDAEYFVATQFDPTFLLLPLLPSNLTGVSKPLFQPVDDLLESHTEQDKHLRYMLQHGRELVEDALSQFCDSIDAGERMFRINEEKVLGLVLERAERVVASGLPPSLEERYVTRALEAPVLSIKREESTSIAVIEVGAPGGDSASTSFGSQSTSVSTTPSVDFSDISTTSSVSTVVPDPTSAEIKRLQRLRVAINFIFASYFSETMVTHLQKRLKDSAKLNFQPLEDHLEYLTSLRAEAMASRSLGDFSRKRGNDDDDEAAEQRAEKKRKQEEEDKKRKAGESRGVRDLKKVNVTGMKKMSDFFGKKPAAAKATS